MAGLLNAFRQYARDAMPGGALNPEVTRQGLLDAGALATTPVPFLGDAVGLLADANRFVNEQESRTPMNFGLSALGALPFVPSLGMLKNTPMGDLSKIIQQGREYESRLWGGAYAEGMLNRYPRNSPGRKTIVAARERYNALRQEAGLPPVTDWSTRPSDLLQNIEK